MNHIDDEQLRFYLRNKALIDQWAALSRLERAAANDFLASCSQDVQDLATKLGDGIQVHETVNQSAWPHLFLIRPDWWLSEESPYVGIGLEWDRGKVSFAGAVRVYSGVRTELKSDVGKDLRLRLGDRLAAVRRNRNYSSMPSWPAYHYEPPPDGDYWVDLAPYREQLVEAVRASWLLFAPIVDEALSTTD